MTCDELFELLTDEYRAENDECRDAMKQHLSGCRSCRRLADALEPAVELFRECSAGEDFTAPSVSSGPWSEPEGSDPAWNSPARGWNDRRCVPRSDQALLGFDRAAAPPWMMQVFGGDLLRLAAAILMGLTLGALVWGQDEAPSQARGSAGLAIAAPASNAQASVSPRITLASLLVTAACLPDEHRPVDAPASPRLRPAVELLASADLGALACCTTCHASLGMASHSKSATLQVVRSCQACHTF
jgi:hypothetical protein